MLCDDISQVVALKEVQEETNSNVFFDEVSGEVNKSNSANSSIACVLEPKKAKTKGSGRSGRPKLSSNRIKSVLEKKERECKTYLKFGVNHDSRNCLDKLKGMELFER